MFNLNDIIQNAQGGQAIGNLAQQFGLSPQQAQAAIGALLPGLSMGINNVAQSPGGLGGILGQMLNGANADAFNNPSAAASNAPVGGAILGQIFGQGGTLGQVTQQAAQASGVPANVLNQMLPVLASILMGGLYHSMQNQGLGGVLGQLAGAVLRGGQGAPGSMPGNMPGQQPTASAGMGGMGGLGDILGKVFGGGGMGQPAGGGVPGGILPQNSLQPGLQGQAIQLGLDTLSKMFQHGTQVAREHQSGLQSIFNQMMGGKA